MISLVEKVSFLMSAVSTKLLVGGVTEIPVAPTTEVELPWDD